jgi:hypothetical protein
VYKSVIVQSDGALYAPVRGAIGASCSHLISVDVLDDPGMMFGRAEQMIVKLWAVCPGPEVTHDCVAGPTLAAQHRITIGAPTLAASA